MCIIPITIISFVLSLVRDHSTLATWEREGEKEREREERERERERERGIFTTSKLLIWYFFYQQVNILITYFFYHQVNILITSYMESNNFTLHSRIIMASKEEDNRTRSTQLVNQIGIFLISKRRWKGLPT